MTTNAPIGAHADDHRGELDDAKEYFTRSLAIREAALGPMHVDTAYAVHGLGLVHELRSDG